MIQPSPKVDYFLVCYLDVGRRNAFHVHELVDAQLWARHMLRRWRVPTWIERANRPAYDVNAFAPDGTLIPKPASGLRLELAR